MHEGYHRWLGRAGAGPKTRWGMPIPGGAPPRGGFSTIRQRPQLADIQAAHAHELTAEQAERTALGGPAENYRA